MPNALSARHFGTPGNWCPFRLAAVVRFLSWFSGRALIGLFGAAIFEPQDVPHAVSLVGSNRRNRTGRRRHAGQTGSAADEDYLKDHFPRFPVMPGRGGAEPPPIRRRSGWYDNRGNLLIRWSC